MNIVKLDWDSTFFDLSIGKVVITNPKNFDFSTFKNCSKDFDLIYIFSEFKIEDFYLVDRKEIFVLDRINKKKYDFVDTISFSSEIHSYKQLLNLSLQSGKYSRFNIDQNFKNDAYKRLYTEWIDKSISKELAIDVFIKIIDRKIVGFTTLSRKTETLAEIGLVAVDFDYRGHGIAKELIYRTICKAVDFEFSSIQVATQHNNRPAIKLYESTGFTSESITNIYHYWNI